MTSNYNYETGSMTNIIYSLKWKTLQRKRKRDRNQREMTFNVPYARTDIYNNSFITTTIRDWNKLTQATIQKYEIAVNEVKKFTELIRLENTNPWKLLYTPR